MFQVQHRNILAHNAFCYIAVRLARKRTVIRNSRFSQIGRTANKLVLRNHANKDDTQDLKRVVDRQHIALAYKVRTQAVDEQLYVVNAIC